MSGYSPQRATRKVSSLGPEYWPLSVVISGGNAFIPAFQLPIPNVLASSGASSLNRMAQRGARKQEELDRVLQLQTAAVAHERRAGL